MVKSYTGVLHHDDGKAKADKKISDYMTRNIISFHPEMPIYEAMQILLKNGISGAPVINARKELVGVLSEGDCLKEIIKGRYHNAVIDSGTVGDHMTQNVTTISPNMTIHDAAIFFLERRFRRFPVLEDGRVVGLLTQADLMKAVNDL